MAGGDFSLSPGIRAEGEVFRCAGDVVQPVTGVIQPVFQDKNASPKLVELIPQRLGIRVRPKQFIVPAVHSGAGLARIGGLFAKAGATPR